jgi:hypothetical protein
MGELRTRSLLLSIAERSAGLISECQKALRIDNLLDLSGHAPEQIELERFGIEAAFQALMRALKEEAELSAFGSIVTRWDIAQRVANLRRLSEQEKQFPEIVEEPVVKPIVITGLPRSGTTFLQNLLAEDAENQAPRCWQVVYPCADPQAAARRDSRPSRLDRQLRCFNLLLPDLHKVCPLNAWSPQECTEITAHVFQSLRFDSTYHVPSYKKWLDGHGHHAAYRFHKRFLQHLQRQNGRRRWVLKSPDHVFALGALRSLYPDARIVFMHRDPCKVLSSNAQLVEMLRAPFTNRIDPVRIGSQNMTDWALGAANMVDANERALFSSSPIFHLHFLDLTARPIDAVKRLYRHFDLPLRPRAIEKMSRYIAAKPNGGYAKNVYAPNRHGIDAEEVAERFHGYTSYFDVQREPTVGRSLQRIANRSSQQQPSPRHVSLRNPHQKSGMSAFGKLISRPK